jgi:hypothetical protein
VGERHWASPGETFHRAVRQATDRAALFPIDDGEVLAPVDSMPGTPRVAEEQFRRAYTAGLPSLPWKSAGAA